MHWNRRTFLKKIAQRLLGLAGGMRLLPLSMACRSKETAHPAPAAAARPNVLFIAIDDLNDWIAALGGYPKSVTPNFDRLIRRGVLFTRAYCSSPSCNPSRVSLLTGLLPSTTGIYTNDQPFRDFLPDVVTLNQHFKNSGYHVVGCGKIYHGEQRPWGDPEGWDDYFQRPEHPTPPVTPVAGIEVPHEEFDWAPLDVPDDEMADMKVASWAARYLQQEHSRPFFLACGFSRPHLPWYVPQKYFDMYPLDQIVKPLVKEDDLEDVPPVGQRFAELQHEHRLVMESGNWEKAIQGYLATIRFTDACVGRLLDALDTGPARNTIVVMWSDHGFHLGEKLHWRKFTLWEEATRVPLVFAVPGVVAPNQVCGRTVSLLDIYPTLVELCELPPRPHLDGVSLVPLLKDPDAPWERPALTTFWRNNHAVRTERWRYIRYKDRTEELYDHEVDPSEWTNLASRADYAGVKRKLSRWLPEVNAAEAPERKRGTQKPPKQRQRKTGKQADRAE